MSNHTKFTLIGWAGFAIMLVLFFQKCGCESCPDIIKTSDTITKIKYDSVDKTTLKPTGVVTPPDSFIVEVPAKVDTAAILQAYFNVYFYSNTYADSNEVLTINDTVSKNRIIGRGLKYKWLKPITSNTIINKPIEVAKPSRSLYAGVFAAANTTGEQAGCGAQITFQTKKQTLYDLRYDVLQKRVELGASFKLKLNGRN